MKLSRKWLNDFVELSDISDKEYARAMTMSGSIVESVTYMGAEIENVVVGKILGITAHPNADKLSVCTVDVGEAEPVTIVTGAKNVKTGDIVPTALCGAKLPGGISIEKTGMRGIDSYGMLCSIGELGLTSHDLPSADDDGILLINETDILFYGIYPGDDIRPVLDLDDHVAEFEITPNRPDCLSVIGLARESAATFKRPLSLSVPSLKAEENLISEYLRVEIADGELCPRYTAKLITDIKIEPSPKWMRDRLRASGVRPINNIVDVTNYVMLEYGQPMHAFDYSCLDGGKIVVRTAEKGETLLTLDGALRPLGEDMLCIADANKPVGVAGVMGGANSEITDETKMVVFESASFNGPSVRRTASALGMRTDASSRFEKGLDTEGVVPAILRACELVEMIGAGRVVEGIIDVSKKPYKPTVLPLETDRINALLGTALTAEFMEDALRSLDFTVENGLVTVPSYRMDVEQTADLAEEVARMYGYDNIPVTLSAGTAAIGGLSGRQTAEKNMGIICRALGYTEILTYSFISPACYDKIGLPADSARRNSLSILNPLGEDTGVMRTAMLPSMLEALAKNYNNRNGDVRLYENAKVYLPTGGELPLEKRTLSLGAYGNTDFFDFKGTVEAIFEYAKVPDVKFTKYSDPQNDSLYAAFHPGQCARVEIGGRYAGIIGRVHPMTLGNYGIDTPAYAAELDYELIYAGMNTEIKYKPLPRFPSSTRDMAVVCDSVYTAGELIDCARETGGELLADAEVFDVYSGGQIPEGKKSVAISLVFRAGDRTLTDPELDTLFNAVLSALKDRFGAELR
ncbi:MAG: phenylalanine--tRNA ligase subunit beta [Oscillospiraceae bacterium]|jgi:phenylalanyl-tRNA synthetase beta chain|nr:phenylalanine--tRNA ligase subunit beta [Oscillospiraceae bacterium]